MMELSEFCVDPREGCLRMMSSMKAVELYLKKLVIRNRFDKMIKLGLGTGEVESAARRVLGSRNYNINRTYVMREVRRIMRIRKRQVEDEIRSLKHEWYIQTAATKRALNNGHLMRRYWDVENIYRQHVWHESTKKSREKLTAAITKRRRRTDSQEKVTKVPHDSWYKVRDEDLAEVGEVDLSKNYEVYGDIELRSEEIECLNLGPKFMVVPKLNTEDFEVELELECVKARMELKNREEVKKEDGTVSEIDLEWHKRQYRERKDICYERNEVWFDRGPERVLDMSKMRVTDAKYNIRSDPTRAAPPGQEVFIQGRRMDLLGQFQRYRESECNEKGEQNITNMSVTQVEGRDMLQKRVKNGEVVVTMTDKSGKFAVVQSEMYREAVKVHLNDTEIEWKGPARGVDGVEEKELLLSRHAVQLTKVFKMGTKHGQETRIHQAFTSRGGRPGPLYVLVKDHKKTPEGQSMPPTRPVCNARGGPGSRLSNLLSTILNKCTDASKPETECTSTEDALRTILETNRRIAEQSAVDGEFKNEMEEMIVMSLDVKALYPSLRVRDVKEIVAEYIQEVLDGGKLVMEEIDWYEAGKYLAVTMSKTEQARLGLKDIIPRRTAGENPSGPKITPNYWESEFIGKKDEGGERREKWIRGPEPDKKRGHKMIAWTIAIAVETSMSNHMYRFDGKFYHQKDGGPIGDELTQAAARMVMVWFDRRMIDRCQTLGIVLPYYTRYVDDINNGIIPHPNGTRLADGELRLVNECIEADESKPRDQVAACLLKTIANSIREMLQFEEEVGSMYDDGKLPTLDLKLWTMLSGDIIQIRHEFYKKPMASKATLLKNTAYPEGQIKAVMTQEVLRRLRNCSPESTWEQRGTHLTEFACSLKASGHEEAFRIEVFNKAVKKFKQELREHQCGRRDLYRSKDEKEREKHLKGGKATKDSWFKSISTKEGEKVTSVFTVPYTGGKLGKSLQAQLDGWKRPKGVRVKVQEGGGEKLKNMLMRQDPFPKESCGRTDCPLGAKCRERCYQGHVNYEMRCVECEKKRKAEGEGKEYVYYGESSRGCYVRNQGHKEAYGKKEGSEDGFMWNHAKEVHRYRKDLKFVMKRAAVDKEPMRRVLRESVKINEAKDERRVALMNSKNEYFGLRVVRPRFGME